MTVRFSNQDCSPVDSNLRPHLNKVISLTQASSKNTKKVGIDRKCVWVTRCVILLWSMGGCDYKSNFPDREQIYRSVGVTSHAPIRHIVLGCLASFSLFIMFNLCCNTTRPQRPSQRQPSKKFESQDCGVCDRLRFSEEAKWSNKI